MFGNTKFVWGDKEKGLLSKWSLLTIREWVAVPPNMLLKTINHRRREGWLIESRGDKGFTFSAQRVPGKNGTSKWLELFTHVPAFSDAVYSDTPLTVTLLACPKCLVWYLTHSAYSDNLVTVTLWPGPEGITVSGDVCTKIKMPSSHSTCRQNNFLLVISMGSLNHTSIYMALKVWRIPFINNSSCSFFFISLKLV